MMIGEKAKQSGLKVLLLLVLINGMNFLKLSAQNCTQTLKKAQSTYDEGRISEVPAILESCLKDGFNKEEKAASYRLLTLTYLYLDEPLKADESMLMLLRTNHEFKVNTSIDPAEFINLYNKFRTHPIYTIGIKSGININTFPIIQIFSASGNKQEAIKPNIKSTTGFQIGIATEIPLKGALEFCPEFFLAFKGYSFKYTTVGQQGTYEEKLNFVQLPLLLKYSFAQKNYIPFIAAGVEADYRLSALGSTSNSIVSPTTNFSFQRSSLYYSLVGGLGLKSKMGPGIFSFGLRFNYGLNALVEKSKVYDKNGAYTASFGVVASEMKLNTYSVNLGYLIPIYKPKKIR